MQARHGARVERSTTRVTSVVVSFALAVTAGLVAILAAPPTATAAVAPPDFLSTLAGPSQAAMYPSGADVDRVNDRLVVADTGRDRILFYSLDGTKLDGGFGSYGTDPGQFASPRDVTIDGAGNIYVADAENNRIQAFDSTGNFKWQKGGTGTGNETLNTPIGVTWDPQYNILLVASTGQSLIKAWDANGVFKWKSPTGDSLDAHAMRDVSRGPDGRLWVTAYKEHQIKVYDVNATTGNIGPTQLTPVWVLGTGGPLVGDWTNQLNFPYNVVFSPAGDTVYVSDTGTGRVARWDISGAQPQWLPPWGGRCSVHPQPCADPPGDPGLFNHLRRVAIDKDGNVYAADFWGAGFWVFGPNGDVLRNIEGADAPAPGVAEPYSVDVAPSGQVYVMDRLNHRIERFQSNGTYVDKVGARGTQPATFSWPEGVTVAPNGRVWAIDTRNDRIEDFPADLTTTPTVQSYGSTGTAVGEFTYPEGADVAPNGVVWVADTRNDRLQKYDPVAQTFSKIGSLGSGPGQFDKPMGVAVTANAVFVADTANNRVQKLALDGTPVASFSTGLNGPEGIEVAPDGTVWVADTQNSRLVHLSAALTDLGDGFGSLGTGDTQFFDPHDLAFGNDKMYVADTYNNRVQVYSMPGPVEPPPTALTPSYTGQISDPGGHAPVYPAGIAVVDGTWYVADSGGSRVVTLDPTTGAVSPVSATGSLTDPRDLELDAADPTALWVTDTGGNRIVHLARTGQQIGTPLSNLNQPYGLANDATRVYVANTYGNSVKAYNRNGTVAWTQTTCSNIAFSRPRDVGLADNGQIAVADTDNGRIAILDAATGNCVSTFGTAGTGTNQFKSPRSVTSDGSGGLWVADALNYRIKHVSMTGTNLGTPVGTYGEGAQQFRSPHCVSRIPGSTQVAVCDTFNFRISVYDGAGATPTYVRTIGGTKPTNGGFNGPFAVAYGPDGSLYVADWFNHRIQKFNANGQFVTSWGGYGPQDGSLIFPRGITVSAGGEVVVTDSENNRIDFFSSSGAFSRSVKPTSGSALSRPHQTAVASDGSIWVADTLNNRVLHLSSTGVVLATVAIGGTATGGSKPEGVAIDTDGTILVSNTGNNRVERYSAAGSLIGTVAANGTGASQVKKPGGLLVTGTGTSRRLWIANAGNNRVTVLDSTNAVEANFGSAGSGDGQLSNPRGVAFDPTNKKIAVADFANDRISLWNPFGNPPPPDTTNPTVGFTAPASGASLPAGTVAVTGTAADNTSVAGVAVAVQRSSDNLWLQPNGTWAAGQQYVDATLAEAGAPSTTWSLSFSASIAGSYSMTARATDQAANTAQATRSFSVAAADTTAPDGAITAPAVNAVVPPPTVTVSGTGTDNVGVASMALLVKDRDTGLWLRNDGTWGSTTANAQRLATLASPGATSTGWTLDIPLGAGNYTVTARARDAAGNQDATPASLQFSVRVADSVAPDGTMTSPANNATVPMGAVPLTGNATDNTGVDAVLIAIQDTVTKQWLRANGTWSAQYGTLTATLANRGATSTGWSYTFTPPVARKYAVTVIAQDAAGNQDPTKPRVTFTVQ